MYNTDVADPRDIPNAPDIIKAAYTVNFPEVERLLMEGADVNAVDDRDNLTCLHIACIYNYDRLVDVILAHDATHHDVDFGILSKHNPRVAWMHASDTGFVELAKRVHQAGLASDRYKSRLRRSGHPGP